MRSLVWRPWALILAGGDGLSLRALTRQIAGDLRPKQYCPILDSETLLDATRRRAGLVVPAEHHVIVVTRQHEPYYRDLRAAVPPPRLVVQPANRRTGPGILYRLLRIAATAGDVPLVILPSDHYVSDDRALADHLDAALVAVGERQDVIVLLGIEAKSPESDYGWIEPAPVALPTDGPPLFPIQRFWEKPSGWRAERLMRRGCLWNSLMMVGFVRTFLRLMWETTPGLLAAFEPVRHAPSAQEEASVVDDVYARMAPVNFSERVLRRGTRHLATLAVKDLAWSDWGDPARVLATLHGAGARPSWLTRVELEVAV
jgi:mannose-1-phosphate guanylyltransferase